MSFQGGRLWIETHLLLLFQTNALKETKLNTWLPVCQQTFPYTNHYQTRRTAKSKSLTSWLNRCRLLSVVYRVEKKQIYKCIHPEGNLWSRSLVLKPHFLCDGACALCPGLGVCGGGSQSYLAWSPPSVWMNGVAHVSNMLDCISQLTSTHELQSAYRQNPSANEWRPWQWTGIELIEYTVMCHGRGFYYKWDGENEKNEKNDWTVSAEFFHVLTLKHQK